MEISAFFILYLGVVFCIIGSILLIKQPKGAISVYVSPLTIMVLSFGAYTSAMPFSVMFFGEHLMDLDLPYMRDHFLGALGMVCGIFLAKFFYDPEPIDVLWRQAVLGIYVRPIALLFSAIVIFLGYLVTIYYGIGGDLHNLFLEYGAERELSELSGGGVSLLIFPAICAILQVANYSIFIGALKNRIFIWMIVGMSLLVVLICLVRGSRNSALIFALPVGLLFFRHKAVSVWRLGLFCLIALFFFYAHAIVRNYGFGRIGDVNVELSAFAPINGELGTSRSVYIKSYDLMGELEWGKTYYEDALVNLIPRALWPERPPSTAEKFSLQYFNVNELSEGLGFAPVVEAKINFGSIGIFPVFLVSALGVYWLERRSIKIIVAGPLIFSAMAPIAFNWNRIDSNVVLKFFIIYGGMVGVAALLFLGRASVSNIVLEKRAFFDKNEFSGGRNLFKK